MGAQMKNIIIFFWIAIASISSAFGTAQYPDLIIYEKDTFALHSNPLEEYFDQYPDKRPKDGIISSALWRGYVATFEVKDGEVYVRDVEIEVWDKESKRDHDIKWVSVMDQVFPEGGLKISWMNSILILPYGEMVDYVHMGYASTYSNYILLEVVKGNVNRVKKLDYRAFVEFKEKQFQEFKKTDEYKKLVADLKKEGENDDAFIESFLKDFVIDYTSKFLD